MFVDNSFSNIFFGYIFLMGEDNKEKIKTKLCNEVERFLLHLALVISFFTNCSSLQVVNSIV